MNPNSNPNSPDAQNKSDPGPIQTTETTHSQMDWNNTAPELGQDINAITRAQAANAPINPPPEKPNSPTDSVDLDIYSTIGSDLVQDDAAYKKDSENLEKTIGSLFNENYLALETVNDPHLREIRDCVQQKGLA